ncbi:MAG: formylglycine-generating enzyme family protein [Alphaproteobacteria bacterium]|nr:formylglycine-generating enzyme family protein [Alphaproteobacteria bacterium]
MIAELLLGVALAAPASFRDCDDCPEMVTVPAGQYVIGAPDAETDRENMASEGDTAAGPGEGEGRPVVRVTRPQVSAWEKPQTSITIAKPFAIGKYEVTLAEYRAFVAATNQTADGGCRAYNAAGTQFETIDGMTWREPGFAQSERDPVVCVNWRDAQRFVEWLSFKTGRRYRLPTEAEWEYAARGGTSTARHWGDGVEQACEYANVGDLDMADKLNWRNREFTCRDGFVYTSPVGSFKPNAFGLYDMLGNVWEIIEDCWHWNHFGRPTDARAWESKSCTEQRMNKGGSWSHYPWGTRAAVRNKSLPTVRFNTTGFRVVKDIE